MHLREPGILRGEVGGLRNRRFIVMQRGVVRYGEIFPRRLQIERGILADIRIRFGRLHRGVRTLERSIGLRSRHAGAREPAPTPFP